MGEKLLLVPWFMGILYSSIPLFWFFIHPVARRWQKMQRSPYRLLLPLWTLMIAVLMLVAWPWHSRQIYSNAWFWLPALLFFLLGVSTYHRIGPDFGRHNLTGETELRPQEHEQALVTTGLHQRMRHPIYFAHLCMFAACTIGSGLLVNFILFTVSVCSTYPLMIWLEERELKKRFGQSFLDYKARVPVIPFQRRFSA